MILKLGKETKQMFIRLITSEGQSVVLSYKYDE